MLRMHSRKTFTVFLNENLGDSASIREIEIGSCPQTPESTLSIKPERPQSGPVT